MTHIHIHIPLASKRTADRKVKDAVSSGNATKIITLARKHVGNGAAMDSSARLCLSDAIALFDKDDFDSAAKRALKSLSYSIGIMAEDYKRASAMASGTGDRKAADASVPTKFFEGSPDQWKIQVLRFHPTATFGPTFGGMEAKANGEIVGSIGKLSESKWRGGFREALQGKFGAKDADSFKPGEKVFIQYRLIEGGCYGVLEKIEGGQAYVKNDRGRVIVGPVANLSKSGTVDAYRGTWNERVEEEEYNRFKVGSTVTQKGVKAIVKSKGIVPSKKTEGGETIPAHGIVTFETVDAGAPESYGRKYSTSFGNAREHLAESLKQRAAGNKEAANQHGLANAQLQIAENTKHSDPGMQEYLIKDLLAKAEKYAMAAKGATK